ncbi:hypothetical protein NHQ30_005318 [Ciborinia camelliae]|nr:hypothetical protein NHQ30_005318 [Ciborinia camelliae]
MKGLSSSKDISLNFREEGNNLFKARDFDGAIKKYLAAARTSREDPKPFANLSTAYHETGKYKLCIEFAKKSLSLTKADEGCDVQRIKKLESLIAMAEDNSHETPIGEQKKRRVEIGGRLERYHQSTLSEREYSPVSLDKAQSLFDPCMEEHASKDEGLSFFNAEIGDARNFFSSLIHIAHCEGAGKISERRYHFTLNDANRHTLARNLIIFKLLDKLSLSQSGDEELNVLNTIFIIHAAPLIPEYAFRQLQDIISELLESLKSNRNPLKWVHLFEADIPFYIGALENWTSDGEALKTFSNKEIVRGVKENMKIYHSIKSDDFQNIIGPECILERKAYSENAILLPPDTFMFDPSTNSELKGDDLSKHVLDHWRTNPTLLDLDWYTAIGDPNPTLDVRYDPFDLVENLSCDEGRLPQQKNTSRLFYQVTPFFEAAAKAIKKLGVRLQAELVLGDYIDVAERLNFDMHHDPNDVDESVKIGYPRPKGFPLLYDCINISNLPDYKGGHLTTFLHALPILKQHSSSYISSFCLHNVKAFPNMDNFISEYQLVTSQKMLQRLTSAQIIFKGIEPFPLADNTLYRWDPLVDPYKRPSSALLSLKKLKVWFHGLFLKLALPMRIMTNTQRNHQIYSPLNLSILFRQLAHLHRLGYHSHWLSEILVPLFTGTLTTTARPPRHMPMNPDHVSIKYSEKPLCIAPFSSEMKTLATIFAPLLPFRLNPNLVYRLDEINEYTINLRSLPSTHGAQVQPNCLILLFRRLPTNTRGLVSLKSEKNLRVLLDPSWGDEVKNSYRGKEYENWRAEDVIVWSTFKFDVRKKKAKVWMPKNLVDQMVKDEWNCALWRRDIWEILGGPEKTEAGKVGDVMKMGRKWDEDFKDGDDDDESDQGDDDSRDGSLLQEGKPNPLDDSMFHAAVDETFKDIKKSGATDSDVVDDTDVVDKKDVGENDVDSKDKADKENKDGVRAGADDQSNKSLLEFLSKL